MNREQIQNLLLRISLTFSFFYVAQAAIRDPLSWLSYAPQFVQNAFSAETLLFLLAAFHIIIGLWVLSGWKIFVSTSIAAAYLLAVVIFNFTQMDILFRDISLLLVALALAVGNYRVTY